MGTRNLFAGSLVSSVVRNGVWGGWGAFIGWLVAEFTVLKEDFFSRHVAAVVMIVVVSAAISLAVATYSAWASGGLVGRLAQFGIAVLIGAAGGLIGGVVGSVLFAAGWGRPFSWAVLGAILGSSEGTYERAKRKVINGSLGGFVGGLLGGMALNVFEKWLGEKEMTGRAVGFVVLGIAVAFASRLVQVVLREGALTVLQGYKPGRTLILGQSKIILGRSDRHPLPFLGPENANIESDHVIIRRTPDGNYVVSDNNTACGTRVNGQVLRGDRILQDGDLIEFGTNVVQFNRGGLIGQMLR